MLPCCLTLQPTCANLLIAIARSTDQPHALQGSVIIWQRATVAAKSLQDGTPVLRERNECTVLHDDIIGDKFWAQNAQLLRSK